MLEQLVESKENGKQRKRMGNFLLSTFTVVVMTTMFALIYSLFSYNVALGSDGLDVSTLVSPVSPINEVPPAPEPISQKMMNQKPAEKTVSDIPVRQANIQRVEESPSEAPKAISVSKNTQQVRPNSAFSIGKDDINPMPSGSVSNGRDNANQNGGSLLAAAITQVVVKPETPPPPPIIKQTPKVEPKPEKPVAMISGGVVNGKATNLVKPAYSAAARSIRAGGQVKVQVTIDEDGNVIKANAISGHPLLLQASTIAAKSSKFSPTTLTGKKVKVTGVIIYNFTQS